jgi:mono/diheme cytochrome c family protein/Flp pilus assembly protein TadD
MNLPRRLSILSGLALLFVGSIFGRDLLGVGTRYAAAHYMRVFDFGKALAWLDRTDLLDSQDPATELLRAACYRQLHDVQRYQTAMQQARRFGASRKALDNETTMAAVQSVGLAKEQEGKIAQLIDDGLSPHDVAAAFISGYIVRKDWNSAESLRHAWSLDYPDHPHPVYFRGVLRAMVGDVDEAQQAFEEVLAIQPCHQLALIALAQQYEAKNRLTAAIEVYVGLADSLPENETVLLGLSRTLRKSGRAWQASAVLSDIATKPKPISALAVEMGHIEVELGHYDRARKWFDQAVADDMKDHTTLTAAAIALAGVGNVIAADRIDRWIMDNLALAATRVELLEKLTLHPDDQEAATEYRSVLERLSDNSIEANPFHAALATTPVRASPGMQLYREHCAMCHGATGNGDGRAAHFLFSRPRNLRDEPFRLVSARNGISTDEDLRSVIRHGIPGTSMIAMPNLKAEEVDLLIEIVKQMRSEGIRQQVTTRFTEFDEPINEREVADIVEARMTPGELVIAPDTLVSSPEMATHGRDLFIQQACASCHGVDGAGDDPAPLYDDQGQTVFPRDLRYDAYKGGSEPRAIYTRIAAGMPGSPHPPNLNLSHDELSALVAYCRSLDKEPKRKLTNHERAVQASRRRPLHFFAESEKE